MDKKNPNLMKIIISGDTLKFDSSKDYIKLREEIEKGGKINVKNYSILCLDMKYKFIIDGDNSFNQWKNKRKELGNFFLILSEQNVDENENKENLYQRLQIYDMDKKIESFREIQRLKNQDITLLEEMRNKLNKEFNDQMENKAKLDDKVKELEKKKKEIEKKIVKKINKNKREKKKAGRKKKEEKDKGDHTKKSKDNIMRKIKAHFLIYVHNLINKSLKNKNLKFLKLDSKISKILKKDFNITLMKTKFKDLYQNYSISKKYRSQKSSNFDINQKLITKLYHDNANQEIETINLLNLTYLEFFHKFVDEYLEVFLNIIWEEEKQKNESEENIREYIEDITKLCYGFENWFRNKKGRNRNKNKNIVH